MLIIWRRRSAKRFGRYLLPAPAGSARRARRARLGPRSERATRSCPQMWSWFEEVRAGGVGTASKPSSASHPLPADGERKTTSSTALLALVPLQNSVHSSVPSRTCQPGFRRLRPRTHGERPQRSRRAGSPYWWRAWLEADTPDGLRLRTCTSPMTPPSPRPVADSYTSRPALPRQLDQGPRRVLDQGSRRWTDRSRGALAGARERDLASRRPTTRPPSGYRRLILDDHRPRHAVEEVLPAEEGYSPGLAKVRRRTRPVDRPAVEAGVLALIVCTLVPWLTQVTVVPAFAVSRPAGSGCPSSPPAWRRPARARHRRAGRRRAR